MTVQPSLLVVDDNEANRDALSRRLRTRGYTVTEASDGAEGLALANSGAFDLVLLDIGMPGMNGLQVLEQIRHTRSRTELPVVMATARSQGADIVEAFRLGANDYVTKPIDFPVALARIETHLAHQQAVRDLRDSEERYALAVQGANDGLWDWDLKRNTVYWSPRWKAILGCETSDLGAEPEEWFSRVHEDDMHRVRAAVHVYLESGQGHFESEHRMRHRNGSYRWVRCRGAAVRDADRVATRFAGSIADITDSKIVDPLTGLANRLLFVDVLERAIQRARRPSAGKPGSSFALLVIGLDRFRSINESLGPVTADRLLAAVARRLYAMLRGDATRPATRSFTLARLGGDEFTLLLEDQGDAANALRLAQQLLDEFRRQFDIEERHVFVSAAVGIAVSSTGYESGDDVLRDAALALSRAKANATHRCELFDPAMRHAALSRLRVENELRQAVNTGALLLHYQPIVALGSGAIEGFEALIRYQHVSRGLVAAGEFIGVAEETGIIFDIERRALVDACRQIRIWQQRFGDAAPTYVAVNLSSRRFTERDLVAEVRSALEQTGARPSSLKLEITEAAFIGDVAKGRATLAALRAMGVSCSLDDFGTGYSSLSYLQGLPVNTVKVDQSFIAKMVETAGAEMVRAIVALAHTFHLDVVAEGVERPDQVAMLRRFGCDHVQGYFYSPPVDVARADALIGAQPWLASRDAA
jgi:diguanylate cyclase (GGDEF)-like protein/PAS domain S-box-containing protein